jgi:hypothetical protein
MAFVRNAKRLKMWLLAPSVHPLLLHHVGSPLNGCGPGWSARGWILESAVRGRGLSPVASGASVA